MGSGGKAGKVEKRSVSGRKRKAGLGEGGGGGGERGERKFSVAFCGCYIYSRCYYGTN